MILHVGYQVRAGLFFSRTTPSSPSLFSTADTRVCEQRLPREPCQPARPVLHQLAPAASMEYPATPTRGIVVFGGVVCRRFQLFRKIGVHASTPRSTRGYSYLASYL